MFTISRRYNRTKRNTDRAYPQKMRSVLLQERPLTAFRTDSLYEKYTAAQTDKLYLSILKSTCIIKNTDADFCEHHKKEERNMFHNADFYYFSPAGGTKETGEIFCAGVSEHVEAVNLGSRDQEIKQPQGELAVIAVPVYGGRIPSVAAKKLEKLEGKGTRAVTLVVYGTRAYEDALLELNHIVEQRGFQVTGSAALVARHSIVPEVGAGRPDGQDREEILEFARKVLKKAEEHPEGSVKVPGNYPYKKEMTVAAAPISLDSCSRCGKCSSVCPTGAVRLEQGVTVTELKSCILCMACVYNCPERARVLPPSMQEAMEQKLGPLKSVRREPEYFL